MTFTCYAHSVLHGLHHLQGMPTIFSRFFLKKIQKVKFDGKSGCTENLKKVVYSKLVELTFYNSLALHVAWSPMIQFFILSKYT